VQQFSVKYFSGDPTYFLYIYVPFMNIANQMGDVWEWNRAARLEVYAFSHG